MAHARQQIREAAAAAVTSLTLTGANVFQSRLNALPEDKLPAIRLYTNSEESENLTLVEPVEQQRTLELIIEGVAKVNDDLDDTLDDVAEDIEVAIASDVTLGGIVQGLLYVATEVEMSAEGDQPVGIVRLAYQVDYLVYSDAPGTLIGMP